jgi:hypothetical protein
VIASRLKALASCGLALVSFYGCGSPTKQQTPLLDAASTEPDASTKADGPSDEVTLTCSDNSFCSAQACVSTWADAQSTASWCTDGGPVADFSLSTQPCMGNHDVVAIGHAGDTATFEFYDHDTGRLDAVVFAVHGRSPSCVFGAGTLVFSSRALSECRFRDSINCF